jgi:hypothetical protein
MGVFDDLEQTYWGHSWQTSIHLYDIAGGVPANREMLQWHLKNRMTENWTEAEIAQLAEEIMLEQKLSEDEALDEAISRYSNERAMTRHRRSRKVDGDGRGARRLFVAAFQIKAAIREAGAVCVNSNNIPAKYGSTNKGWQGWVREHIFVPGHELYLTQDGKHVERGPVPEEDEVRISFPERQFRKPGEPPRAIKYTEVVEDVDLTFTVSADVPLSREFWGAIWTTAQKTGLGADRAHFGEFEVTDWAPLSPNGSPARPKRQPARKKTATTAA